MKIVRFDRSGTTPAFQCEVNGGFEYINFVPPIDDLDTDLNVGDYVVELLINPMLSNESDVYTLCVKQMSEAICDRQTIGVVFPVLALDSDQVLRKGMCNYLYIAFWQLLERLKDVSKDDFSSNFESNVCVCVFSKKYAGVDNPLHLCIHSLRKYGYSYFEDNNNVLPIDGYKRDLIIDTNQKNINIELKEPILYHHPIVDRILRDLKSANNVTHRFVLLYQIIELLMEDAITKDIKNIYKCLHTGKISANDYFESVSKISRERKRISNIFEDCGIEANDCKKFSKSCKNLFDVSGLSSENATKCSDLFYNFRNKMMHSYRALYAHKTILAETIQNFEQIVLLIVEKYPRSIVD